MINSIFGNDFSSMSAVKAKVDIYNGDTFVTECTCSYNLEKFKVLREGDNGKFFGFGVCHKLSITIIDIKRDLPPIEKGYIIEACLGDGEQFDCPFPKFHITEITRDEKTNDLTCTAYDNLYFASSHTKAELTLEAPYTIRDLAEHCATLLGVTLKVENVSDGAFETSYEDGANLVDTDTIRAILNAISEATQTVFFINNNEELVFKRLDRDGDAVRTITREDYYTLNTKTNRTLSNICSATELGNNVSTGDTGIIQYVRDNPLWELRTDIATLLDNALTAIGGLTINQFNCDWIGDYRLEVGDKINLVTEDGGTVTTFLLSDTMEYIGTLNQITSWEYTEPTSETASNPSNIGDKINQTFAKVDKVNQRIELVASDVSETKSNVSKLQVDIAGVSASVQTVEQSIEDANDATNARIDTLTKEVAFKVDKEEVAISIESRLQEGVDKVITSAQKYSFDDTGLKISSTGSNISTLITEDGMRIYRGTTEVLTADNEGVKAEDLHATTYLIIGTTSRLEDREHRTACFWIGD